MNHQEPKIKVTAKYAIDELIGSLLKHTGVDVLKKALEEKVDKQIPSEFISYFMELILKYNLFDFHGTLYQQLISTAIGSKPSPSYANIYLAKKVDPEVKN